MLWKGYSNLEGFIAITLPVISYLIPFLWEGIIETQAAHRNGKQGSSITGL